MNDQEQHPSVEHHLAAADASTQAAEAHTQAAEAATQAAESHRLAAEAHNAGDHETAAQHARNAHAHHTRHHHHHHHAGEHLAAASAAHEQAIQHTLGADSPEAASMPSQDNQ